MYDVLISKRDSSAFEYKEGDIRARTAKREVSNLYGYSYNKFEMEARNTEIAARGKGERKSKLKFIITLTIMSTRGSKTGLGTKRVCIEGLEGGIKPPGRVLEDEPEKAETASELTDGTGERSQDVSSCKSENVDWHVITYLKGDDKARLKFEMAQVRGAVNRAIWPKLKFINNATRWDAEAPMARCVMEEVTLKPEDKVGFWEKNKRVVEKAINLKRNNIAKDIKKVIERELRKGKFTSAVNV